MCSSSQQALWNTNNQLTPFIPLQTVVSPNLQYILSNKYQTSSRNHSPNGGQIPATLVDTLQLSYHLPSKLPTPTWTIDWIHFSEAKQTGEAGPIQFHFQQAQYIQTGEAGYWSKILVWFFHTTFHVPPLSTGVHPSWIATPPASLMAGEVGEGLSVGTGSSLGDFAWLIGVG